MNRILMSLLGGCCVAPAANAYDPMADLVSTAKQEIQTQAAVEAGKNRVLKDPRHAKRQAGHWVFFQGQRGAAPGEACTAAFWKGDQMVTLVGPSSRYKGALLSFVALQPPEGFPRPDAAGALRTVQVSLQQGGEAPVSLKVFNRSIGGMADELSFGVPSAEALLAGMEERQSFKIQHEGRQVFALEWHSGLAARDLLQRCLKGESVDGRELP